MDSSKVGVVLVNWNTGEETAACVKSLLASESPPWRIVVFDNGSTDGSPDKLGKSFPDITLIRHRNNIGFSAANNRGIEYLLDQGADYIWILNNDTVVHPHCLTALLEVFETDPDTDVATGKILYEADPERIWYAGGDLRDFSLTAHHRGAGQVDHGQYDKASDVTFVSGCCMLIKQSIMGKTGLFNEQFFAYHEDVEWCWRAARTGIRLRYVPTAVLWHKVSVSVKKNTAGQSGGTITPVAHYLDARNRIFNIRLSGSHWLNRISASMWYAGYTGWIIAGLLWRRRWSKLRKRLAGIHDGISTPLPHE